MSKHTPGPWDLESDPCHFDTLSSIVGGAGRLTPPRRQLMVEVGGHAGYAEQEANARLIAAAPDLLEALEKAVREYEGLPSSLGYEFTHLREMRAAIAKAKGEA
jgi:hypothetical protein